MVLLLVFDLGISVAHVQMMPLLTELENPPLVGVYKDDAPDGALAPTALSLALRSELRGSAIDSTFESRANRGKMSKLRGGAAAPPTPRFSGVLGRVR